MSIKMDMTKLVTADAKATEAKAMRARSIKDACATRIAGILDANTMANIQSAAIIGELSTEQMEAFRRAQQWISAMLSTARHAISEGIEPDWPEIPEGLRDLVAEF
ncbi:hypothetical protein [Thioclava sp.]|uniref:hypothetical protein n=1 Tax=Thioclava sp. TaxID=1933450 RepID=UPI003AA8BFFF